MNEEEDSKKLFWHRAKLLGLILALLSPFIGGWLALYVFELRPESGNYGELIVPVRKMDWPVLETSAGEQVTDGFGKKWTFVLFADGRCEDQCRGNLYYMRQIRILLARDVDRLQNVLIIGQPLDESMKTFLLDFPDFKVVEGNRDAALYRQFEVGDEGLSGVKAKTYLIDPDQNLMMYYPPEYDHYRVLEDIRKLMKISQIG